MRSRLSLVTASWMACSSAAGFEIVPDRLDIIEFGRIIGQPCRLALNCENAPGLIELGT